MNETLISFLLAIFIAGVVVFRRLHGKVRKGSGESAALKKKIAVLEQHSVQLREAQRQAETRARDLRFFYERPPSVNSRVAPPFSPVNRPEKTANLLVFTERQKEFAEVRNRLDVIYVEARHSPQEKHIAEFDSIVDRLERVTGCNMSIWLGIPPQKEQTAAVSREQLTKVSIGQLQARDSDLFSTGILSLRAFCSYQIAHSQLPQGFVLPPPKAADLIH
jgi:hypothetical protein